jgi:hypothetical protein
MYPKWNKTLPKKTEKGKEMSIFKNIVHNNLSPLKTISLKTCKQKH